MILFSAKLGFLLLKNAKTINFEILFQTDNPRSTQALDTLYDWSKQDHLNEGRKS